MSFQVHSCGLCGLQIISPLKTVRIEGSWTGMVFKRQRVLMSMVWPYPAFQPQLVPLLSSMIQLSSLQHSPIISLPSSECKPSFSSLYSNLGQ